MYVCMYVCSANIVPVHKKGEKQLPTNYRPISLTCIIVKTMERIIHRQLVYVLDSHKLLDDCQFGFAVNVLLYLSYCRLFMIGLDHLSVVTVLIAYF